MRKLFEPSLNHDRERLRAQWQVDVAALPPLTTSMLAFNSAELRQHSPTAAATAAARHALGSVAGEVPENAPARVARLADAFDALVAVSRAQAKKRRHVA